MHSLITHTKLTEVVISLIFVLLPFPCTNITSSEQPESPSFQFTYQLLSQWICFFSLINIVEPEIPHHVAILGMSGKVLDRYIAEAAVMFSPLVFSTYCNYIYF